MIFLNKSVEVGILNCDKVLSRYLTCYPSKNQEVSYEVNLEL